MAITPFEAAKLLAEYKINLNAADFARQLDKFAARYKGAEGANPAAPPPVAAFLQTVVARCPAPPAAQRPLPDSSQTSPSPPAHSGGGGSAAWSRQ